MPESYRDFMENHDYDSELEEQLELFDQSRRWLFASAREFHDFPANQSLTKLNIAQVISTIRFSGLVQTVLDTGMEGSEQIDLLAGMLEEEDRLRVEEFNEIVDDDMFETGADVVLPNPPELVEIDEDRLVNGIIEAAVSHYKRYLMADVEDLRSYVDH